MSRFLGTRTGGPGGGISGTELARGRRAFSAHEVPQRFGRILTFPIFPLGLLRVSPNLLGILGETLHRRCRDLREALRPAGALQPLLDEHCGDSQGGATEGCDSPGQGPSEMDTLGSSHPHSSRIRSQKRGKEDPRAVLTSRRNAGLLVLQATNDMV